MARNENWTVLNGKLAGDPVTLWVRERGYGASDFEECLMEGTITKITSATRAFTMPGAIHDGDVQYRKGWRDARDGEGIATVDGQRVRFTVATPTIIARLTDPCRELREALEDAMRDIRHSRPQNKTQVAAHTTLLEAALASSKALLEALPADDIAYPSLHSR